MLRIIAIIFFLASGCEENEIRSVDNRPSDSNEGVDGYLSETTKSIKAGESATITISKTNIAIPEGGLGEDSEIRLRTLKSFPDHEQVASLGDSMGDIIEITMYNKETKEIYGSSVLDQPYGVSQELSDVSDEANLKYVGSHLPAPTMNRCRC